MDISNSIVSTSVARSFQENRQARADQAIRVEAPARPSSILADSFDAEQLARRGSDLAENRIQRLNASESAPFRARQALDTYQQTQDSSQAYEQGELVGIDLFA